MVAFLSATLRAAVEEAERDRSAANFTRGNTSAIELTITFLFLCINKVFKAMLEWIILPTFYRRNGRFSRFDFSSSICYVHASNFTGL